MGNLTPPEAGFQPGEEPSLNGQGASVGSASSYGHDELRRRLEGENMWLARAPECLGVLSPATAKSFFSDEEQEMPEAIQREAGRSNGRSPLSPLRSFAQEDPSDSDLSVAMPSTEQRFLSGEPGSW